MVLEKLLSQNCPDENHLPEGVTSKENRHLAIASIKFTLYSLLIAKVLDQKMVSFKILPLIFT